MKAIADIADTIRELTKRSGTALRALAERGLRYLISGRQRKQRFRLHLVTAGGQGLCPELEHRTWDKIRELSYVKDTD
jgi:hypothetical protein